jgi:glycosyltransferase involved in cell wall biosynthesis
MNRFSIVIICKNEAEALQRTLPTMQTVTDDIVLYDSGSTDNTIQVAQQFSNVHTYSGPWLGFGPTRQKAVALARYDWILSIDADEAIDETLQQQLLLLNLTDEKTVYDIRFKTFLGNKELKWGEWGGDHHIRLFNRQYVNWNEAPVHESLIIPDDIQVQKLKGHILHFTMNDMAEYSTKMTRYALLNAEKYFAQGKKANWLKRYMGGPFAFIKYYLFLFGFLDGWEGLVCARMTAYYTSLKYARLYELQLAGKK